MQVPRLQEYDDTPLFNTRAIVRMTNVKAARLRAWERRYAILSPQRASNHYRLYSERDIAVVGWLRDRIETGLTISQAIALLRNGVELDRAQPSTRATPSPLHVALTERAQQIFEATMRLDEAAVVDSMRAALALYSIEEVCEQLIIPAFNHIGDAYAQQHEIIMQEHFLSAIVRSQIDAIWHATSNPPTGPIILVGCVAGEQHDLGSMILALYLRRSGLRVSYFGANVETSALIRSVKVIHPSAICLSVTMPANVPAAISAFRQLIQLGGIKLFIGGQAQLPADAADVAAYATILGTNSLGAIAILKRTLANT